MWYMLSSNNMLLLLFLQMIANSGYSYGIFVYPRTSAIIPSLSDDQAGELLSKKEHFSTRNKGVAHRRLKR